MKRIGRTIVQWILYACARAVIAIHQPFTIAVSGSTDKTLVKEMLSLAFREHGHRIRVNPKSFNTEIGLPLAILYLPSGGSSYRQWCGILIQALWKSIFERSFPPVLIVELGVDHPGDMEYLLRIVHPMVAVMTTFTNQYLPNFQALERYAQEFEYCIRQVPSDGLVVLNSDDERIRLMEHSSAAPVWMIGEYANATVRLHEVNEGGDIQSWKIRSPITQEGNIFSTQRRGAHHRFAVTAAFLIHQWYDKKKLSHYMV